MMAANSIPRKGNFITMSTPASSLIDVSNPHESALFDAMEARFDSSIPQGFERTTIELPPMYDPLNDRIVHGYQAYVSASWGSAQKTTIDGKTTMFCFDHRIPVQKGKAIQLHFEGFAAVDGNINFIRFMMCTGCGRQRDFLQQTLTPAEIFEDKRIITGVMRPGLEMVSAMGGGSEYMANRFSLLEDGATLEDFNFPPKIEVINLKI